MMASVKAKTPAISVRMRGSRITSGDGSTGPAAAGAAPFTRKASRPVPKTIPTAAMATHSVTPPPVARVSRTAITGTEAMESTAEYVSRSASPLAGRSTAAQK